MIGRAHKTSLIDSQTKRLGEHISTLHCTSLKRNVRVDGLYEEGNMFTLRKTPSTAKPSE